VPDVIGLKKLIDQQILRACQFSEAPARLLGTEPRHVMTLLGDNRVRIVAVNGPSLDEVLEPVQAKARALCHHRGHRADAVSAAHEKTRRIRVGEPDGNAPLAGAPQESVPGDDAAQLRIRKGLDVPAHRLGGVHAREQGRAARRALGNPLHAEAGVRLDEAETRRLVSAQKPQRRLLHAGERVVRPLRGNSQAVHEHEKDGHATAFFRRPLRKP